MFDVAQSETQPKTPPGSRMQRVVGRAAVTFAGSGRATRLRGLHQSGSAKAMLPKVHAGPSEVVFLNTAGGLTGGDRLEFALELGAGGEVVATTQTAERAYASAAGRAHLGIELTLGRGARLDWLPQETILFDRSALSRRTVARLDGDAELLMAEMLVLGRAAMGETVASLRLDDRREVWRGGHPVLIEPLRLTSETLAARPALLTGARAIATLAVVAPGAEDRLSSLRAALAGCADIEAATSAWDGKCVARIAAPDGLPLRRAVSRSLEALRSCDLPRVWQR